MSMAIRNINTKAEIDTKEIEKAIIEIQKILVKDEFIPMSSAKKINQYLLTIKDKIK